MHVTNNPKSISINGETKIIPYGVGLVATLKGFGFGTYQWRVTLPKGVGLWPAVWLAGETSWPPEIDVIEAYSDSKGDWSNRLNTNIHVGSNGENHKQIGAKRHGSYINKNEDIDFTLVWLPNCIKIYYNGFLCRRITSKYDLAWFNKNQIMILNTALNPEYLTKADYSSISQAPFVIKYYSFYK